MSTESFVLNLPEELSNIPPEKRMVSTKLSRRPQAFGFHLGAFLIFLSALFSFWSWSSDSAFGRLAVRGADFADGIPFLKLLTSLFVHGDWAHLLSNSYMLLVLSIFVFGTLTSWLSYALLLLALFLVSSMGVSVLTLEAYPPESHLIGISGMVYLLGGFWFVNFMFVERTLSWATRLLRAVGVGLVIFFPTTFEPTTSYLAHAYGFLFGLVLGAGYFYVFRNWFRSFERYRWY